MYIHIAAYIAVLIISFFSGRISPKINSLCLLLITYVLALSGLITLGLVGYGFAAFFLFCVIGTAFYGDRGGIISVIVSILSISLVWLGVETKVVTFSFNVNEYIYSPNAWITGIIGMVVFSGLIVVLLSTINKQLVDLVNSLELKNKKLEESNKRLVDALNEKRELECGLEHAQKMELVGTIAGGVAHDLNNVLSSSVTYPELLLRKVSETSSMKKPLETIKKSGLKAAAIVNDLLTLTRRGVASQDIVSLNNVIEETVAGPEVETVLKYHPGVSIDSNLEDQLWNIEGSEFHIMKTLLNLISNAAEAMPDGGRIQITTENIEVNDALKIKDIADGSYAALTVSDQGTGISEKDREKIFEPFYTKKVMGKSGTGLGMAVVKNTVIDHHGYICMDTMEGIGTSFSLYFPRTEKKPAGEKVKLPISEYSGKGESILIVDDVEEQRQIAVTSLKSLGYNVTSVSNGEDAVRYIKKHHVDLLILDMIMAPGIDGLDTYRRILKIKPDQKAIIISGFSETDRLKKVRELGAGAYVKKPYLLETIGLAVRSELDKMTAAAGSLNFN